MVTRIPFPIGTLFSEQRRIATYLNDLQTKVDMLKHLQAEIAAEIEARLPTIFAKAFKGEL